MDADATTPRGTRLVVRVGDGTVEIRSRAEAVRRLGITGGYVWDDAVMRGEDVRFVSAEPEVGRG